MTQPSVALYRFFAADDALLYVGITANPGARLSQHRRGKDWWSEVARIDIEHHPDRAAARAAELAAIRDEAPRYNIADAPRPIIQPCHAPIPAALQGLTTWGFSVTNTGKGLVIVSGDGCATHFVAPMPTDDPTDELIATTAVRVALDRG